MAIQKLTVVKTELADRALIFSKIHTLNESGEEVIVDIARVVSEPLAEPIKPGDILVADVVDDTYNILTTIKKNDFAQSKKVAAKPKFAGKNQGCLSNDSPTTSSF